jgi:hypothetical protein
MYNVFSQCIRTPKGKVCVRAHEKDLDVQQVYKGLLDIYADQLTMQHDATSIRSELTIMKLDDKWCKSYATFLNLWCSRVQELESIKDKAVDDDTKRIWFTNTLQSHKEMNNAISQAITTELTLGGINGTASTLPWDNFYNMVVSTAKLLDNAAPKPKEQHANVAQQQQGDRGNGKQKNGGRGCGDQNKHNGGHGSGHNNGQNNGSKPPIQYTKNTGSQMSMAALMIFTSQAQRDKMKELNIRAKSQSQSNNHNITPSST